jgi:hypothetical protein
MTEKVNDVKLDFDRRRNDKSDEADEPGWASRRNGVRRER